MCTALRTLWLDETLLSNNMLFSGVFSITFVGNDPSCTGRGGGAELRNAHTTGHTCGRVDIE